MYPGGVKVDSLCTVFIQLQCTNKMNITDAFCTFIAIWPRQATEVEQFCWKSNPHFSSWFRLLGFEAIVSRKMKFLSVNDWKKLTQVTSFILLFEWLGSMYEKTGSTQFGNFCVNSDNPNISQKVVSASRNSFKKLAEGSKSGYGSTSIRDIPVTLTPVAVVMRSSCH